MKERTENIMGRMMMTEIEQARDNNLRETSRQDEVSGQYSKGRVWSVLFFLHS